MNDSQTIREQRSYNLARSGKTCRPRLFSAQLTIALVTLFLFVIARPAVAGDAVGAGAISLKDKIDKIVQPLIESSQSMGIVVGTIRGSQTQVFGYGEVARSSGRQPDGETVFEIGSMTKVFTSLLLADMAENGLVKLEDPVARYLPDSVQVPSYDGRQITLLDLATHTSGLPRLPSNDLTVRNIVSLDFMRNPYVNYTAERLYRFLSRHKLQYRPGSHSEYSNLGVGLLGHALSRAAERPYEQLVIERICQPLGMNDTAITLSPRLQSRLAQGYLGMKVPLLRRRVLVPMKNWDFDVLAGCGALRSTANDLLKLLKANLYPSSSSLERAIAMTHVQRYKESDNQAQGLGWVMCHWHDLGEWGLWHSGCTWGYSSYMGMFRKRQVAVVVLSNTLSLSAIDLAGLQIQELLTRQSK